MIEPFKFKYVKDGNATGLFATKGEVGNDGVKLGDHLLPFECVYDTTTRDERLVVTMDPRHEAIPDFVRKQMQGSFLVLHVSKLSASQLEKLIDRHTSAQEAAARKAQLQAEGKGHLFRTEQCPCCAATVDLSELPDSPYHYCRFCETVFGRGMDRGVKASNTYRQCDECGYYDRVQGYGEFYFYFLLVVYGFSHKRRHLCDDCGASLANKLLAVNAIFLLGVPNAVICAIRARAGRDRDLGPLAKANRLAKKGKLQQAEAEYDKVFRALPGHPGAHFNLAVAHLRQNNADDGVAHLNKSFQSCPSFEPGINLAHRISG